MLSDLFDTPTTIAFVVGVVLPAVVALVTKEIASSRLKNTVLLALSALSSVLIPLIGSTTFDAKAVLTSFATVFGTSTLTYLGIYKPQGATAAIQAAVPGGIGAVPELPEEGDEVIDVEEIEEVDDPEAVADEGAGEDFSEVTEG
jgi:uncharacterized membrane protein AbrB (regulator of aidB expression)